MRIYYITLNTDVEARRISRALAELAPESVNESFSKWLSAEVPLAAGGAG
jgi:hypothetical protein